VFNELVESVQIKQDTEIRSDKIILKDCLDGILIGFESEIKAYEADIQINFNDVHEIYNPKKYIESIFTNLISNTLKYKSPDRKPVIKIKLEKINENITLSVADNGLGIDLIKHQDNLFKIRKTFHKHPDAKGFGLYLIKTQVEAIGGKIWATSIPNIGSTFFVEFKTQNT
jgi:light-regulated signal transduction histidine kinase (bacteriophytochrome)